MSEIVKILQDAEKIGKRKLVDVLRKAGKEYYGEVLLHNQDSTCSVLQKEFMIVGKTPDTAEKVTFSKFVKGLSLDNVREISQKFAKRDF